MYSKEYKKIKKEVQSWPLWKIKVVNQIIGQSKHGKLIEKKEILKNNKKYDII